MQRISTRELSPGMLVADAESWGFGGSENYQPVISVENISTEYDAWVVTISMFGELNYYLKFGHQMYDLP